MKVHRMLLVVEDERVAREALRALFVRHGWTVATAATVAEGLALLDPPPDCMILDLDLPDGRGETLLQRIRAADLPIRVTITTGCDDRARLVAVSSLQPEALFQKPVQVEEILRVCGMELAYCDHHETPDALG